MEGIYLNITKAILDQPTANIILKGKKLESFSSKIRSKTRMPTLTIVIQHSIRHSDPSN